MAVDEVSGNLRGVKYRKHCKVMGSRLVEVHIHWNITRRYQGWRLATQYQQLTIRFE